MRGQVDPGENESDAAKVQTESITSSPDGMQHQPEQTGSELGGRRRWGPLSATEEGCGVWLELYWRQKASVRRWNHNHNDAFKIGPQIYNKCHCKHNT